MEEINGNKYKPQEVLRIAETLGLSTTTVDAEAAAMFEIFPKTRGVDSSMEVDQNSMTDSSSYISNESSISLDSSNFMPPPHNRSGLGWGERS